MKSTITSPHPIRSVMSAVLAITLLSVLFLATSVHAAPINAGTELVVNGGFESNAGYGSVPTGWARVDTSGGDATNVFYTYDDRAHGGSWRVTTWGGAGGYQTFSNPDGFASDVTSLTFDGWMRWQGAGAAAGNISVVTGNMTGTTFTEHDTLNLTVTSEPWAEVTGNVDVHHGVGTDFTNYFKITAWDTGGKTIFEPDSISVFYDDFSLKGVAVPEPAALALLCLGGLVLLRRRK